MEQTDSHDEDQQRRGGRADAAASGSEPGIWARPQADPYRALRGPASEIGGERNGPFQFISYLGVDNHSRAEPLAAVDDAVRDDVGVAKAVCQGGLELLGVQLRVRRVDLAVRGYAVVLTLEGDLDTARAGVDDKDTHRCAGSVS